MTKQEIDALQGRELDCALAELALGYRRVMGPRYDYDGSVDAVEILVPPGFETEGFAYPPKGVIPVHYHVPKFSSDEWDSRPLFSAGARKFGKASHEVYAFGGRDESHTVYFYCTHYDGQADNFSTACARAFLKASLTFNSDTKGAK